eukprot:CAMPEP_0197532944 /NCGR_PEP_ID=MMETSP1318-20131121/41610_1 /TAXON_ID=552666 /ORGANISM="Partenskyella glossopodia, Strain RCC365" /LENGTH=176 /DNA_ID=CAMNT_0043089665 /DNA_START=199 /DNA_END=726 /DNA_ORIENTATION=+
MAVTENLRRRGWSLSGGAFATDSFDQGAQTAGPGGPEVRESHKGVRTFIEDGWTILVGKNANDNDRLSTKIGNANDFWFHVAGVPGSHVVVRNPQNESELPRNVLTVAAGLAAWYSKAKGAGKASVHYTTCKHVKKLQGSPAGQVLLGKYKAMSTGPLNPEAHFPPREPPKGKKKN